MDRVAIVKIEQPFSREAQDQLPALAHREVEKAMVSTFLHSQSQGPNHARIRAFSALSASSSVIGNLRLPGQA
jgi:hypothetical protein